MSTTAVAGEVHDDTHSESADHGAASCRAEVAFNPGGVAVTGLGELAPMGFVAQLCLAAPNVGAALQQACRFSPIWCEVRLEAEYTDSRITVKSLTCTSEEDDGLDAVRALGTLARMLTCVGEREVAAHAAHAPQRLQAAVSEAVGCAVQEHESALSVCFDAKDIERPNARADLPLYEVLTRHAEQRLVDLTSRKTVDARVRETIALLANGNARAYLVAARLGIGVRTLHRRLRAEGTSFRRIHDEIRMERCLLELKSGGVTAKHVAEQLGFADPASFHRAFKRWTGSTVRGYRGQAPRRRISRPQQQGGGGAPAL